MGGSILEGIVDGVVEAIGDAIGDWWTSDSDELARDWTFIPRESDVVSYDGSQVRQDDGHIWTDTDGDGDFDVLEFDYTSDSDVLADYRWDSVTDQWKRAHINFESSNVATSVSG